MAKPPREPHPPDLDANSTPHAELADAVDAVFEGADLANTSAPRLTLQRVELRSCRLTGADLHDATLVDTTFADCRLDLVNLRFAKLERVVFRDCRLCECDLLEARLKDVRFERCELVEAVLAGLRIERVELRGCNLDGASGIEALRGARMPWQDVVANAPLFAGALGIEIAD